VGKTRIENASTKIGDLAMSGFEKLFEPGKGRTLSIECMSERIARYEIVECQYQDLSRLRNRDNLDLE
jgi:hypothetical protein